MIASRLINDEDINEPEKVDKKVEEKKVEVKEEKKDDYDSEDDYDEKDTKKNEKDESDDEKIKSKGPAKGPIKIIEIFKGKEPIEFKNLFPDYYIKPIPFVDEFEIKFQKKIKEEQIEMEEILPFLKVVREKYRFLLCDQEVVNLYNLLFLYKKAKNCDNFQSFAILLDDFKTKKFNFNDDFAADLFKFTLNVLHKKKFKKN
jgi:hypothetical protein